MTQPPQTAHPDWPTQLRFPGQAAAPEGPVDMSTMYVLHHGLRRDLRRFAETVPHTPVADTAAWRRLADRWALFADHLHHHHESEDAILWPWLRDRVSAGDLTVLDAMALEHDAIDPALARISPNFARLSRGPDAFAHSALVASLQEARAVLEQHLAHEETDAIAIIQRVATDEEWKQLERRFGAGQPRTAIFGLVAWAVEGLTPEELEPLLERHPWPMRLLVRLVSPRFSRRERRCFGR